jgi:hypothetical protein
MNLNTSRCKHQEALDLMIMSVYKPDSELRMEAQDLGCYDELMDVREQMLEMLQNLRNEARN